MLEAIISNIPAVDKLKISCEKCGRELAGDMAFCPYCGRAVNYKPSRKKRGNGQGTVIKTKDGKYKAIVTLGYYTDNDGKRHRRTRSKTFEKKKDAVAALPELLKSPKSKLRTSMTFKQLYDEWLPTHRAGKATVNCYKAAIRYFEPVWGLPMREIDVDDLQECIDNCSKGKRTKQNMRTVCGLVYKYGIPRRAVPENLNLSQFLSVDGEGAAHRESFTDSQIAQLRKACGTVPHAEDVVCMIFTGFRPSEFLALTAESYDKDTCCLTGGAKTAAGKGRKVTVSPKIRSLIEARSAREGYLFTDDNGNPWALKEFTEKAFYPALEGAGIDNPIVEVSGGVKRHKYTPHSCRHTFATLLKRIDGADKDKLELIGHSSAEMLRYYQDVALEDLRKITDAI